MTEKWHDSCRFPLEYTLNKYRCKVCGVTWDGGNPLNNTPTGAFWALHGKPHEKTDEIMAETIAIQMGAF